MTERRAERQIMLVVLVVLLASLWIFPLFSGLWLDELGTWWVIRDGLDDAIGRSLEFHGQSPLYYAIAWSVSRAGSSEALLRLPSFIAGVVSLLLVYRLTTRLVDRRAALPAVIALAGYGGAAFAFSEVRPYGFALLLLAASALATVRWLDSGRFVDGVVVSVLAAGVVWAHYLFALALAGHLAYAIVRVRRRDTAIRMSGLVLVLAGTLLLLVPLGAQLASIWSRRGLLSTPSEATLADLVQVIVYPVAAVAIVLGGLLAIAQGGMRQVPRPGRCGAFVFFVVWLIVPPIVLFAVSVLTGTVLLSPRYFVSIAPASAILFGWAWSTVEPSVARRMIGLVFAIVAVGSFGSAFKAGEDWRGAAAFVREETATDSLVLLHPALIESSQLEWFDDRERESYLLSPIARYPMTEVTVGLPYALDDDAEAYLESEVLPQVRDRSEFVVVTRYPNVPFREWLDGRLGDEGWRSESLGTFGVIEVIRFSRDDA